MVIFMTTTICLIFEQPKDLSPKQKWTKCVQIERKIFKRNIQNHHFRWGTLPRHKYKYKYKYFRWGTLPRHKHLLNTKYFRSEPISPFLIPISIAIAVWTWFLKSLQILFWVKCLVKYFWVINITMPWNCRRWKYFGQKAAKRCYKFSEEISWNFYSKCST